MSDGDVVIVCGLGHLREEGRTRRIPWLFSQQSLTEKGQKRKEGREEETTGEGTCPLGMQRGGLFLHLLRQLSLLVGSVLAFFTCWARGVR